MEGHGRKLAWIAIVLSGLALIVSLSNRAHTFSAGRVQQFVQPAVPMEPGQFTQPGAPGQFAQPATPRAPGQFRQQWGPRSGFAAPNRFVNVSHMPGRGFFPFMIIGGVLKLAFVALLIIVGLRLLSGRGFGGPWNRGRGGPGPWGQAGPPPNQSGKPGPEPPYTGDTQQM